MYTFAGETTWMSERV